MANLKTISAALKLVDTKKENLKKAFVELQSHSHLLSSFSLSWSDLDSHFTSLQNSLTHRFHLLESLESQSQPTHSHPTESTQPNPISNSQNTQKTQQEDPSPSPSAQVRVEPNGNPGSSSGSLAPSRPELRALCESMDGKGLRKFIFDNHNERNAIRVELPGAMRAAPDPGAMVLDAMDGFSNVNGVSSKLKGDKDGDLNGMKRCCVVLLEVLMEMKLDFGVGVRERAKALALEWKGKVKPKNGEQTFEVLGLLHLVAAFGLGSEFNVDELVEYFVAVAQFRQAEELCRVVGLGDKVADLIQKLINKGKTILAIKFIFEFKMTEKFPPVPLLKAYLKDSKKAKKKVSKDGNNSRMALNEATAKEVSSLKSVIKVIQDHNLDSEYPKVNLEKRIELLEKQKANRKRPAPAPPVKLQQPQHQQQQAKQQLSGSKRSQTAASVGRAAVPVNVGAANSIVPQYQQSRLQSAGLLPDRPAPYVSSSAAPYGTVGTIPNISPYTGPSAGLYVLPGAPVAFPGNPGTANSHPYSSEPYVPSSYYDRPTAYGGYGVPPQYHPSYYPQ